MNQMLWIKNIKIGLFLFDNISDLDCGLLCKGFFLRGNERDYRERVSGVFVKDHN